MPLSLQEIEQLFLEHGHHCYQDAPVNHLRHALQTASLAENAGASAPLITACLLHDLGHVIAQHNPTSALRWIDDKHHYFVLPFLRGLFDRDVLEPIRLHVEAKRYLCFIDPDYETTLSAHSRHALTLQGGSFDAGQAIDFCQLSGAHDAIKLSRWDDQAKVAGHPTKSLDHYLTIAQSVAVRVTLLHGYA